MSKYDNKNNYNVMKGIRIEITYEINTKNTCILCVLYLPVKLIFFAITFISSISSFVNKLKSRKSSSSLSFFGIGIWLQLVPKSSRVPSKKKKKIKLWSKKEIIWKIKLKKSKVK